MSTAGNGGAGGWLPKPDIDPRLKTRSGRNRANFWTLLVPSVIVVSMVIILWILKFLGLLS
jgi:hypothetical protein